VILLPIEYCRGRAEMAQKLYKAGQKKSTAQGGGTVKSGTQQGGTSKTQTGKTHSVKNRSVNHGTQKH
jgi:hypothetical protein